MNAIYPAVQKGCSETWHCVGCSRRERRAYKRIANRRSRRALDAATRRFERDLESFWSCDFAAPTLSAWDVD